MRVFLAGKVDAQHGAWRDALMDRVWVRDDPSASQPVVWRSRWVLTREPDDRLYGAQAYPAWPAEPNQWVLYKHQYVGPFVVQPPGPREWKNLGEFHGNTWTGCHGDMDDGERQQIVEANRRAIRGADLFFCYVNTPDCFGTLVELGYAAAHRVYTYVLLGPDAPWSEDDYWYAGQTADSWWHLGDTPLDRAIRAPDEIALGERRAPSPEEEARLVRSAFHHALSEWATRPSRTPTAASAAEAAAHQGHPGEPHRAPRGEMARLGPQLVDSFSSIAQWTSDPRVRNEAARMLGVLGSPIPYAPGQRG